MSIVDRLGACKAAQAALASEQAGLQADLISRAALHPGKAYAEEGEVFRACVSWSDKRATDWAEVIADLGAAFGIPQERIDAVIRRRTRIAPMVPTVRVSSKQGNTPKARRARRAA